MTHDDSPEKLARMRSWLEKVGTEVGVEPSVLAANEADLLSLVSAVAHGPSRPGAPLTAFLVGVAVGRGADQATLIDAVRVLADHENEA